jgi:hypothetical protein
MAGRINNKHRSIQSTVYPLDYNRNSPDFNSWVRSMQPAFSRNKFTKWNDVKPGQPISTQKEAESMAISFIILAAFVVFIICLLIYIGR